MKSYVISAIVTVVCVLFARSCVGQTVCNTTLDAMFVLDGSNSIGETRFSAMVTAVNDSLGSFSISLGQTRVGVVLYSGRQDMKVIRLTYNQQEFQRDLGKLVFPDGTTETAEGLRIATQELTSSTRLGVPQLIIILTDADNNDDADTIAAAQQAWNLGIRIFSVGMEADYNYPMLVEMATNKNTDDVFSFSQFYLTVQKMVEMSKHFCVVADCERGVDLVFVLDGSNSVGETDYFNTLRSIENTTKRFLNDFPSSRIGVLTYATFVSDDYILPTSDPSRFDNLDNLQFPDGSTGTAAAIRKAATLFPFGDYDCVMVVITDGVSNDRSDTQLAAEEAKEMAIIMYSIGVGNAVDKTELDIISSSGSGAALEDFDTLNSQLEDLVRSVCANGAGVVSVTPAPTPSRTGCSQTVDVMFVMDLPSNPGEDDFRLLKSTLSREAASIVAAAGSRVAVFTNFDIYLDFSSSVTDIDSLEYRGDNTDTTILLLNATTTISQQKRNGVSLHVILILSDPINVSQLLSTRIYVQQQLPNAGASDVHILGITNDMGQVYINFIANNDASKQWLAADYNQAGEKLSELMNSICQ